MTQLELITKTMEWNPPVFLFGGFAEDALLYGKAARPHTDIDLLVFLDELPLCFQQASKLGFNQFQTRWQATPRGPLATGCVGNGLDLEFCVMERSADGRVFFDTPSPAGGLRRNWLPQDALAFPPQMLEAAQVRVASPLLLYQTRLILGEIFGLRPKDAPIQNELRERFFADKPETDLAPLTEELAA